MDELRLRKRGYPASARGPIELLQSCDEGIQPLLNMPLVGLVQDPNEDSSLCALPPPTSTSSARRQTRFSRRGD
jgi:hypothetical protein